MLPLDRFPRLRVRWAREAGDLGEPHFQPRRCDQRWRCDDGRCQQLCSVSHCPLRSVCPPNSLLCASLRLCCRSTYRQYELQTQGHNKAQPKSIIARGFVLKEDENLDGTDARVEDPNCIIPRLRSETESSIGQDATERAIRELVESEEQNAGNELVVPSDDCYCCLTVHWMTARYCC